MTRKGEPMSEHILKQLARIPAKSTASMADADRENAIWQMMADLKKLATDDGCIAAAWALELAQAPLVVAAPQLLAACKKAEEACRDNLKMYQYKNEPLLLEALTAIRAAIAAAEGRS